MFRTPRIARFTGLAAALALTALPIAASASRPAAPVEIEGLAPFYRWSAPLPAEPGIVLRSEPLPALPIPPPCPKRR